MDIRLNWLRLKHFKGVTEFILNAEGKNCSIFGDNGTGKTTQFDSELWLLFGKDSTDRSAFKVKPQDEDGNDIHNLQTEVEAEYLADGKPLKLKKMQEEKWTKKQGTEHPVLTGNTISYWWNEVPVKEGEYTKKINELVNENIFRMITNPTYFNTRVPWQDRRKILLEICGDKTDAEVIASDSKLSRLTEILSGKSIDDYKKILAERLKGLEKEREDIRPRIDELSLTIPKVEPDYSDIEAKLHGYKEVMAGIDFEMTNASNIASIYRKKQQDLYSLKGKLENIKTRIGNESGADRKKLVDEQYRLDGEKYRLESDIEGWNSRIEQSQKMIDGNAASRQKLITEWATIKEQIAKIRALEFAEPDPNSFVCSTCGQNLPDEMREGKLDDARARFENTKKFDIDCHEQGLEKNKASGIALRQNTETLQKAIDDCTVKAMAADARLIEIENRLADIDIALSEDAPAPDYSTDPEFANLQKQITAMQAELDKPIQDATTELLQHRQEVQEKIDGCNRWLNNKTVLSNTRRRIDQLKDDEKRIAALITELEGHKYLMEQFVVAKVNLMESNIASRFKFVKYKMFNLQVNGGIDETCDAMIDGVPYSDLNHGKKINAGLDCINTLCEFYGVTAPVFIDFRESVSEIIETRSQIINLIKNKPDKKLRVEVEG